MEEFLRAHGHCAKAGCELGDVPAHPTLSPESFKELGHMPDFVMILN